MNWNPEADHTPVESITVFGVCLKRGDCVRLWPQKSADIIDMALKGKVAILMTTRMSPWSWKMIPAAT